MRTLLCLILLGSNQAFATSVDWSGVYRFEFTEVHNTSLDSAVGRSKSYILNHLGLIPKIIVSDGINVVSKFEVLPNQTYKNSQLGQPLGAGLNRNINPSNAPDTNTLSTQQRTYALEVSQLYVSVNQEYGSFLAGRAPLDFGLGITYSNGAGPFDHWQDTLDLVGFKFEIGNMFIMPIIGKQYDPSISRGSDVNDMIWHLEYDNPETESSIGVFHRTRSAKFITGDPLNDVNAVNLAGTGATKTQDWNTQHVNIFFARGFESVKFKFEAGFDSGNTGVKTASLEEVKLSGYGVAGEIEFPYGTSNWNQNFKFGIVSGDDPTTSNYEGYWFDRNYDLAFIMFNHPVGQADIFRTNLQRNTDTSGNIYRTDESVDEEAISNVVYFAPRFDYKMNDKWYWTNTIAWAQLVSKPVANADVAMDVGFEYDLGFTYKPTNRVTWVNQVGLFFPGQAWKAGAGYNNSMIYGVVSKAAISF